MKFEYGIIVGMGILVAVSLFLVVNHTEDVPYWNYLNQIKPQEFEGGCDTDCKEKQENRGYICAHSDQTNYICRPPREIRFPEQEVQILTAFPPTFGEFAYFPDNQQVDEKNRIFDISNATLVNNETREIKVEYYTHFPANKNENYEFSATLFPGDTFVSHCLGGNSKTAHIVEYVDSFEIDGKVFIEFWGRHVTMPDELLPCPMPALIEQTIPLDLRMEVDWGLENENVFYGKQLSYWKNLDENSLVNFYENLGGSDDHFFENLGILLIKSYSTAKLHELEIFPDSEMKIDWVGIRPSLPPSMGFEAKVNSTEGKNYLITGTIQGNEIQNNFWIAEDNGRRIGWTPAFEYTRVQINGTDALQICSMLKIACIENPVWDAVYRHDENFTYFFYETPEVEHYVKIDDNLICHSIENFSTGETSELECQKIR